MSEHILSQPRTFLFLQGMASGFFAQLGAELSRRGHEVRRINFNGGDWLFWRQGGGVSYRKGLRDWPAFLQNRLRDWSITDVVLFGDSRPLHAAAIPIARRAGVRIHVVEEGYMRPNCITIEDDGVNGHSALPRDPRWYRDQARVLPAWEQGVRFPDGFSLRAWEDVAYTAAALMMSPFYPGFRTHRPWHPLVEYVGWLSRLAADRWDRRRSEKKIAGLKATGRPYHLFPLQLDCDTQIRIHSEFRRLAPSIAFVIKSFAAHADPRTLLVLKEHPLDNRLTNWSRVIRKIARAEGVLDRVVFIESAPLETLLPEARSVVTVNSTVGVLALSSGLPVKALGEAIYDIPTLTFQGDLDAFWRMGRPADAETLDAFRRVLMQRTQVNGGFFSEEGLRIAVRGAADRLERQAPSAPSANQVPSPDPARAVTPACA